MQVSLHQRMNVIVQISTHMISILPNISYWIEKYWFRTTSYKSDKSAQMSSTLPKHEILHK